MKLRVQVLLHQERKVFPSRVDSRPLVVTELLFYSSLLTKPAYIALCDRGEDALELFLVL